MVSKTGLLRAAVVLATLLCMLPMLVKTPVEYALLCAINGMICAYAIMSYPKEPFSSHKIVHIFILSFFLVANALQFIKHETIVSLIIHFDDDDYILLQLVLLFILAVYNISYIAIRQRRKFNLPKKTPRTRNFNYLVLLLISVCSFAVVLFVHRDNLLTLFFRGIIDEISQVEEEESVVQSLLIGKFIRPMAFVSYMIARLGGLDLKHRLPLFIVMIFSIFPTSLARNAVAMYWIPVFIVNFKVLRKKYIFPVVLIFGLFFIFPLFDNFRYFDGTFTSVVSWDYLVSMNFDASQMFMTVQKWDVVTWGKQLLGVLLFFVPRSLWPGKPVGSGAAIADMQGAFGNVSMPWWGEGYINFGYLGVLLFTLILSFATARLDVEYWKRGCPGKYSILKKIFYYFFVGSLFFILRGDLLSSYAFLVGTILSVLFVYKISSKRI